MKGSLPIIITQAVSYKRPMCFSVVFFCCWFIGGVGGWVIQIIKDSQS
jgi:hypothetical protein